MKYLIHSSLSMISARGLLYDEAELLNENGHSVYILFCDGFLSSCFVNPTGSNAKCRACRNDYHYELKKLSKGINYISLREYYHCNKKLNYNETIEFEYSSVEDIKKLKYMDISIGLPALSSYITHSRNLNPKIDHKFRNYFDSMLLDCVKLIKLFNSIIMEYDPDEIYLMNGRLIENRPIWELARKREIPFTTFEFMKVGSRIHKAKYILSTPYNIPYITKQIHQIWENSLNHESEKYRIGEEFFYLKRESKYKGDKVYTRKQINGLLPNNYNSTKKNIVIFNSSEDEFASIGEDYERYSIFRSQVEGIKKIIAIVSTSAETHIYLRIHPNLNGINYKYHLSLLDLEIYNNISIIHAESPISTYSLVDIADTIIVFGSTIGIESVYWGKPTILLSGAEYYGLEACYIPKSVEELEALLKSKLIPKSILPAIKYGYYLNNSEWESAKKIDFNYSYKTINIFSYRLNIVLNNWQKLLGSRLVFTIVRKIRDLIYKFIYRKNTYIIPTEEN